MLRKELFIGFLVGIAANLAGIYLYIAFFSDYELEITLKTAWEEEVLGSLIALGALLNFLPFFVFLKKKQYYRVRGVLMATFLAALVILGLKIYQF